MEIGVNDNNMEISVNNNNMSIMEKVFHYNRSKMNVAKCNDDIWFKGRDIANGNPLKAIRVRVDPGDKRSIDGLLKVSKGVTKMVTPLKGGLIRTHLWEPIVKGLLST